MKTLDLEYITNVIGNLSAMPIRLYKNDELVNFFSMVELKKDPAVMSMQDILKIKENVSYYVTPDFDYYGIVNHADYKIIIGPSRQIKRSEQELRELSFNCGVDADDAIGFISNMQIFSYMPLNSFIQILLIMNYILNGEKLSLGDIELHETTQASFRKKLEEERIDKSFEVAPDEDNLHNTLAVEQTIMNIIRKGDKDALKDWTSSAPAVRPGKVAYEQLRQLKNIFIVTATLVSRAAIRGGMDINEALSLSDSYIQKCEMMNDISQITNLQYNMVLGFTEKVSFLRSGKNPSKLMIDVKNYIRKHLSDVIKTSDIADSLYISRGYLSAKFKEETNETLTDFILKEKIEEAKRLLQYSDKPILAISSFLGFSSQSHFNNTFKKHEKMTPREFRKLNT